MTSVLHEAAPYQLRHPQGASLLTAERARQRSASAVELALEEIDPHTGVCQRQVVVDDESDTSSTREGNRAIVALLDDLLADHPEWPAPAVVDGQLVTDGNPVAQWLFRSPALREWRCQLVPSAMALYPVQRPDEALPSGSAQDDTTRLVLLDSLDATGIRTRARVMAEVVRGAAARCGSTGRPATWVSLACGAAVPVLDARAASGCDARLVLVDLDARALAFAERLAADAGLLVGEDVRTLHRDLVRSVVARPDLVDELGPGSADVVEALGIFEYFADAACVRLLRHAFRLVRDGGALVIGNMLRDRPQLAFNQRGAGWPRLHVRSADDLVDLVRRAGLPLDRTTVTIPQDGVYAVVDITR